MKIKPINPKLKPLLEQFLSEDTLQSEFIKIAKELGYEGDDITKVKVSLFTPSDNNEICFATRQLADLFVDYQIIEELRSTELYSQLLDRKPEIKPDLIKFSRDILNNKEIDNDVFLALLS